MKTQDLKQKLIIQNNKIKDLENDINILLNRDEDTKIILKTLLKYKLKNLINKGLEKSLKEENELSLIIQVFKKYMYYELEKIKLNDSIIGGGWNRVIPSKPIIINEQEINKLNSELENLILESIESLNVSIVKKQLINKMIKIFLKEQL